MSRLADTLARLKKEGRAAFVPFITAGDPDMDTSFAILSKLPEAGADVIELGMPFSDPMADGPAVQASSMRALHAGKVLQPDTYRLMTTVVPTRSGRPTDYACGLATLRIRGEPAFEHVGRDPGYMSETLYVAKPAISVVVLMNTDRPRADVTVMAARLAAVAMGRPYPGRHATALTRSEMQALAGLYQRGAGQRTIVARDGRLYTKRDGGSEHVLNAASANELYFDEVLDYFTVTRDASGKVVALEEFSNGETPPLHLPKRGNGP